MSEPVPDRNVMARLLDVYTSIHYFELERSEKITARTPIIFAIYSLLLGGIAFMLNDFPTLPEVWSWQTGIAYALFWLAFIVEIMFIGYSCTWAYKFMFVDGYMLTDPLDLYRLLYGVDIYSGRSRIYETDVLDFLLKRHVQTASINQSVNMNKHTYYMGTLRWQAYTILVGALCLIAYFALKFNENPRTEVQRQEFRYVEVDQDV